MGSSSLKTSLLEILSKSNLLYLIFQQMEHKRNFAHTTTYSIAKYVGYPILVLLRFKWEAPWNEGWWIEVFEQLIITKLDVYIIKQNRSLHHEYISQHKLDEVTSSYTEMISKLSCCAYGILVIWKAFSGCSQSGRILTPVWSIHIIAVLWGCETYLTSHIW